MAVGDLSAQENLTPCDQHGALQSTSEAPPAHYILNIQQFSLLTEQNVERYESSEFEAGGYKWKLVIHPNGNKSKNVREFLSVYLAVADPTSFPPGWEVYTTFRIFLLDQNNDNYLILEDAISKGRRFHRLRTEWGFDQFIGLEAFGDSSNGYLHGDNCAFGAEVFVCKERSKGKIECLSMVKDAFPYTHRWYINNYSKVNADREDSNIFTAGDHKWRIQLYPNGKDGIGGYISLNLALADPANLPTGMKILAEFTLRIWSFVSTDIFSKASYWFSPSKPEWGWRRFLSHESFFQKDRGFFRGDACYILAEVAVHGTTTIFG